MNSLEIAYFRFSLAFLCLCCPCISRRERTLFALVIVAISFFFCSSLRLVIAQTKARPYPIGSANRNLASRERRAAAPPQRGTSGRNGRRAHRQARGIPPAASPSAKNGSHRPPRRRYRRTTSITSSPSFAATASSCWIAPPAMNSAAVSARIDDAADRAASLTSQLLAFSRRQVLQPKVFNLNTLVQNLEKKMLRRLIGEDVEMRTVLADDLGHIRADRSQLEQVVMNLVVKRGATRCPTVASSQSKLATSPSTSHTLLVIRPCRQVITSRSPVSDTRRWHRSPKNLVRIFEPFFTTKELGKGTGLGPLNGLRHRQNRAAATFGSTVSLAAAPRSKIYFSAGQRTRRCSRARNQAPVSRPSRCGDDSLGGRRRAGSRTGKRGTFRRGLFGASRGNAASRHFHLPRSRRPHRSASYRRGDADHRRTRTRPATHGHPPPTFAFSTCLATRRRPSFTMANSRPTPSSSKKPFTPSSLAAKNPRSPRALPSQPSGICDQILARSLSAGACLAPGFCFFE